MLSLSLETAPLLARDAKQTGEIMVLLGVIVGLAIILAAVALILRKRLLAEPDDQPMGFTLADLRKLHAMGQLSDEELKRAEEKAVARGRALYLGSDAEQDAEPDEPEAEADKPKPIGGDSGMILDPPEADETGEDEDGSEQR